MQNYTEKIEFTEGRFAYNQAPAFRESAKHIVQAIKLRAGLPKEFYHFQPGGHVAAIRSHVESDVYCSLDIKNFFPSISKNRIQKMLTKNRCSLP